MFEIAWEVCQQVGGIYTVIRSKVPFMASQYGDRYFLIGPYNPETSPLEFEPVAESGPIGQVCERLRKMGLEVHYGKWLVTGQPQTILLNPASVGHKIDEAKYLLWEHHDIPSPAGDELLDSVILFGWMVQTFFRVLGEVLDEKTRLLAHFHEWMGGCAIPEMRRAKLGVPIVFTTHATSLGRILAMHDANFHDHLPYVDWVADARRYNIETQTRIERAAAHGAHVLTTVSDITDLECQHLLGRKADLVLPNGLNIERFVALHEFQNLHLEYKEQINQFVMSMFFPSYSFELDRTLYFFTAGRYEYCNKGFDLTLEALARLNAKLKENRSGRTVVFFLITKRPCRTINSEVLRRAAMLEEIRRNCESIQHHVGQHLFNSAAKGIVPDYNSLVDDYWKLRLQRLMHAWHASTLPNVVTHDLVDDHEDEVLNQLRYLNLINLPADPVKVVYHPDFVSSSNPLFGMEYDQFVRGCHLGIFPSFYEPWGYTPLECVARGIPAVTSDLAGFGTHLARTMPDHDQQGMFVTPRRGNSFDGAAAALADWLLEFCWLGRRERIDMRNRVEAASDRFDWQNLGKQYVKAHRLALRCTDL
ncbi:MAG: glycogen synthase [Phycisphaerae bacterium]